AGNGAYTGGRAAKCREAVMQRPVEAEINRSSRISPSIAATVSWRRETPRVLAATAALDGDDGLVLQRPVQRRQHRRRPDAGLPMALAGRRRRADRRAARTHALDCARHGIRRADRTLVRRAHG